MRTVLFGSLENDKNENSIMWKLGKWNDNSGMWKLRNGRTFDNVMWKLGEC